MKTNQVNIITSKEKIQVEILPSGNKFRGIFYVINYGLTFAFLIVAANVLFLESLRVNKTIIYLILILSLFSLIRLTRSLLWHLKGREVVIVEKNKLTYFRDMLIYKEGKKTEKFNKLETLFSKEDKKNEKENNLDQKLMDDIMIEEGNAFLGFKLNQQKIISTYLPISMTDVRIIIKEVNKIV